MGKLDGFIFNSKCFRVIREFYEHETVDAPSHILAVRDEDL